MIEVLMIAILLSSFGVLYLLTVWCAKKNIR